MGKPGFPIPLPVGATSPPRREGLGGLRLPKNNTIFIPALCGAAAWMTEVNIWRNRVSPSPSLRVGCGRA